MTIAVVIEGGSVKCVIADDPAEVDKEIHIIDYDTDGADLDSLVVVPQGDGSTELACTHVELIEVAGIELNGIRELTEAEKGKLRQMTTSSPKDEIATKSSSWEYAEGTVRARPYDGSGDVRIYVPEKGWRASIELVDLHPITSKPLVEQPQWWIIEERWETAK